MVDRYTSRGVFKNNGGCLGNVLRNSAGMRNDNVGCGCENGNNTECDKLRKRLQTVDFSIIDTVLYLDAYPNCAEALNYYHKLKKERKALVDALSNKCNMPVTSFDNSSEEKWNWTDSPWPWELRAN